MKPIEAGCLAMITGGDFIGQVVQIYSFVGKPVPWSTYNDCWAISGDNVITESKLMRIDDPDLQKESEQELVVVR